MIDHQNNVLQEANPSDAIQIIGWKDLPQAGQEFLQVSSEVITFKTNITYFITIVFVLFLNLKYLLWLILLLCSNVHEK